jgi:drug/metabolite transporter (DMT)-like permease
MRTSIKAVAFSITLAIFLILNMYWTIALPTGSEIETNNFAYWIPFILIMVAMFIIAFYFYTKSKQKTRIKL